MFLMHVKEIEGGSGALRWDKNCRPTSRRSIYVRRRGGNRKIDAVPMIQISYQWNKNPLSYLYFSSDKCLMSQWKTGVKVLGNDNFTKSYQNRTGKTERRRWSWDEFTLENKSNSSPCYSVISTNSVRGCWCIEKKRESGPEIQKMEDTKDYKARKQEEQ